MTSSARIDQRCVCYNLRKAAQVVTQYYDQHLQPSGLRASQYSLLLAVSQNEEISIASLVRKLAKTRRQSPVILKY